MQRLLLLIPILVLMQCTKTAQNPANMFLFVRQMAGTKFVYELTPPKDETPRSYVYVDTLGDLYRVKLMRDVWNGVSYSNFIVVTERQFLFNINSALKNPVPTPTPKIPEDSCQQQQKSPHS